MKPFDNNQKLLREAAEAARFGKSIASSADNPINPSSIEGRLINGVVGSFKKLVTGLEDFDQSKRQIIADLGAHTKSLHSLFSNSTEALGKKIQEIKGFPQFMKNILPSKDGRER